MILATQPLAAQQQRAGAKTSEEAEARAQQGQKPSFFFGPVNDLFIVGFYLWISLDAPTLEAFVFVWSLKENEKGNCITKQAKVGTFGGGYQTSLRSGG